MGLEIILHPRLIDGDLRDGQSWAVSGKVHGREWPGGGIAKVMSVFSRTDGVDGSLRLGIVNPNLEYFALPICRLRIDRGGMELLLCVSWQCMVRARVMTISGRKCVPQRESSGETC